jgi:hypothetical protein
LWVILWRCQRLDYIELKSKMTGERWIGKDKHLEGSCSDLINYYLDISLDTLNKTTKYLSHDSHFTSLDSDRAPLETRAMPACPRPCSSLLRNIQETRDSDEIPFLLRYTEKHSKTGSKCSSRCVHLHQAALSTALLEIGECDRHYTHASLGVANQLFICISPYKSWIIIPSPVYTETWYCSPK